ncbi:MAG: galactose mutarotase, partial [Planctomycetota bacterium]
MNVVKKPFGKTPDGQEADLFTLTNTKGMKVDITNYGGIVVRLLAPDRNGKFDDVVLGFDTLADYLKGHPYFGTIIGRYGNRIGKARFKLDGVEYKLAANNNKNHLHGGLKGFDKYVWDAEPFKRADAVGLKLTYFSKDGEEGYPGNLKATVYYSLNDNNELKIEYYAETDKATPVNLTNHSYFNLVGAGNGDILKHDLMLKAEKFTPIDDGLIPIGEIRNVKGTPFDFTRPTAIGARINQDDIQLKYGKGYDHNFVLESGGGALALAVRVHEPTSGRIMEVHTTEPGVQFYTGNFLDGSKIGKDGKAYKHRYGFCLETQHFPDSPNKPEFPSVILRP